MATTTKKKSGAWALAGQVGVIVISIVLAGFAKAGADAGISKLRSA